MLEVAHLHIGHGARHGELLLLAEASHHNLFKSVGHVFLHLDVETCGGVFEKHLLCLEAHVAEDEGLILLHLNLVNTVDVGDGTQSGLILNGNGGTDQRLAFGVGDGTCHFHNVLCHSSNSNAEHDNKHKQIFFHSLDSLYFVVCSTFSFEAPSDCSDSSASSEMVRILRPTVSRI